MQHAAAIAPKGVASLDVFDLKILRVLQSDASLSLEDISSKVGLSQSPCWRRIKKMEDQKVIRGRVVLLDQDAMALGTTVLMTVRLSTQADNAHDEFNRAITSCSEVVECYSVFGSVDYMLKVVTSSVDNFEQILRNKILSIPNVETVRTMVALKRVKSTTALPI